MKTKRIAAVLTALIAVAVFAQQFVGSVTVTPTSSYVCRPLPNKTKYLIQANLTAQDYSSPQYLFSSVNVFLSQGYGTAENGAMPTDGGFVSDGGTTFWQIKPPIVLKDTDTLSFAVQLPNTALCYKAGVSADGGVSAMALTLHDIVK